jgi:hypothetical protein
VVQGHAAHFPHLERSECDKNAKQKQHEGILLCMIMLRGDTRWHLCRISIRSALDEPLVESPCICVPPIALVLLVLRSFLINVTRCNTLYPLQLCSLLELTSCLSSSRSIQTPCALRFEECRLLPRFLGRSARIPRMSILIVCLCFLLLDQVASQLSNPLASNKHISAAGNKFLERTAAPARKNWPYDNPIKCVFKCCYCIVPDRRFYSPVRWFTALPTPALLCLTVLPML